MRRLLLAYVSIPFVPPFLLLFWSWPHSHLALADSAGIVLLYAVFGFASLLILGTPLLFCYFRLGWTGFVPFMAAGGFCAGLTSYLVLKGSRNFPLIEFFGIAGVLAGFFFRLILFGIRRNFPEQDSSMESRNRPFPE